MLTFLALSAALIQTPPAPPPPTPPEMHGRFMMMGIQGPGGLDKDGDGQVSREEFSAPMNEHFARMDANGDGRLSTEELTAGHGAMGESGDHNVRMIRGAGGPGGPGMRHFEMRHPHPGGEPGADDEREIIIHEAPEGPAGQWEGTHTEAAPGKRIEIRRMGGPGGGNDLDADSDGRISEAEFSAPLREAFARMDADHSGFIEAGERGTGHGSEVFVHRIEMRSGDED